MKLLAHPILSAVAIESLLAGLFVAFPVGPCAAPIIGIGIVYLHYPVLQFAHHVLGVTAYGQQLLVAPLLMLPVWVALLYTVRFVFRSRHKHDDSHTNAA